MTRIVTDHGARNVIGADPRPPKRVKASKEEWAAIRARKLDGKLCRICEAVKATSLHHIVPKSLGGSDVAENCAGLCGSGTTGCHGLVEAHDPWACSLLGARLTSAERAYVLRAKGPVFMARYLGIREDAA